MYLNSEKFTFDWRSHTTRNEIGEKNRFSSHSILCDAVSVFRYMFDLKLEQWPSIGA